MDYATQAYTVGQQTIHVQEHGKAKGPLALLIHGWSSSSFAMSPLIPWLQKRYRCISVDLPGYGHSPRLAQRTTMDTYADLLLELVASLSQKPVLLVGHSMGGMISLTMALKQPDMVERMILICPTISGRLSLFTNLFISPIIALEQFPLMGWLVSSIEPYFFNLTDRLMRPISFAEESGITETVYHRLRADARRPGQGRVRAECFQGMRAGDLRGQLKTLKIPTLVIWGMEDNTVPLKDASALAREWPDADLRIIPQAGHWPHFETPKLTERYIEGFLGRPLKLFDLMANL